MIERSYGWGIGSVPMPRRHGAPPVKLPRRGSGADMIGHLVHDVSWRIVSGSVLASVAALISLALLHSHLPALNRPDPAPVAIAVRFLEAPVPPPERVEKPTPTPAKPEKPRPIPQPEIAPKPSRPTATLASGPPPLPRPQETEAAPPPSFVETALPERKVIDLGPLPDLSPPSDRTARDALPEPGDLALRRSARFDPALRESGVSRDLYAQRREEPKTSAPIGGRDVNLQRNRVDPGLAPAPAGLSFQERSATDLPLPSSATRAALHRSDLSEGVPVLAASQVRQAPQSETPPAAVAGTSFEFFDRSTPPELDRTRLISLTELRTCLDPQTETDLRTRLATLLSRPGTCRSGGVFFDFQQPESAWSIRIDIYNYEGTTFRDRCAALQRAVECSEQGRRRTP